MSNKKQKNVPEQLPLFSNIPFSASMPSRATSKQENDFMVAIRGGIQDFVNNGGDYSEPISFKINFKTMAAEKGIARWESLQRSYARTLNKLRNMPLTQTVQYRTDDGELKTSTFWILSHFDVSPSEGTVTIHVNPAFQDYYVTEILKHPDIQIDVRFHENCKSSYTYPFVNWISARIAEMQRLEEPYPFHISISYEELRQRVPTPERNGEPTLPRPNDYKRNAIEKAVDDINSNPYSQLRIENPDDIVSAIEHRKISEFTFIVSLRERTAVNRVSLLINAPTQKLIDDAGIPSWEYLQEKMEKIGYTKSMISRWSKQKAKVWRALLMTWVQISKLRQEGATDINCGGYLNTMLKARLENIPYKELAISVIMNAPEYVDEVVEETAGYQSIKAAQKLALTIEQNKKTPKPTLENNEFLRRYKATHGRLPKFMEQQIDTPKG